MRWWFSMILWLAPAVAGATILADWSLDQVVAHADRVVIGVVVERRGHHDGRRPLTETEIRVERVLRGSKADSLVVTQYGGRVGDLLVRVPGDPQLPVGKRVLLLTRRARDGRDYLVAMSLGAYEVVGERLRQSVDVAVLGEDGQLRPPPGQRWLRIDEVEAAIERAAQ